MPGKQLDFENPPEIIKAFSDELVQWLERTREANIYVPHHPATVRAIRSTGWRTSISVNAVNVCAAVHWARKQGKPIASTNRGYFYALKANELGRTIDHLMSRVTSLHADVSNLKRVVRRMELKEIPMLPFKEAKDAREN